MTIKPDLAIARLFSAIIYADGYLSEQELEYLETTLKPKYRIQGWDMHKMNMCSISQAIDTITSPYGHKWLDSCQQNLSSLAHDMEALALSDHHITPREAMLCLIVRLALENEVCTIISHKDDHLRFAKSEIIYLEQTTNETFKKEIDKQFDNIRYVLHNFGFNFIYIPKIRDTFLEYSPDFMGYLLNFLYPESKNQKALYEMLLTRLPSASTASFSSMFFESVESEINYDPSLLIKLPTKNTRVISEFALIKIRDSVLETIQEFMRKYDALASSNYMQIQNGKGTTNQFHYQGFHKTFIEYLCNLITDIQIHIKQRITIRFGSIGEIHLPHRLLSAYLTILYFSIQNNPLCKDWKQVEEQYAVFKKIYTAFQNERNYDKDDFYTNLQVDYGKIVNMYFGKLSNVSLQKMAPSYDREKQILFFKQLPPVQIVTYGCTGRPKVTPFIEWVDNL